MITEAFSMKEVMDPYLQRIKEEYPEEEALFHVYGAALIRETELTLEQANLPVEDMKVLFANRETVKSAIEQLMETGKIKVDPGKQDCNN